MKRQQLLQYLEQTLTPWKVKDYAPNGLQVEGRDEIKKIVTAVTANQSVIDYAIETNADAILVHHGYFWKGEAQPITGMKKRRLQALLKHDINLFAYHLPLDIHHAFGNNVQLAKALGIEDLAPLELGNEQSVALRGRFGTPISAASLTARLASHLKQAPLHIQGTERLIETIAWCSGGGQDYIDLAAAQGIDAFFSGEISERTYYSAVEQGIDYFACGHHATERGGVLALGHHLAETFELEVEFKDVPNPV